MHFSQLTTTSFAALLLALSLGCTHPPTNDVQLKTENENIFKGYSNPTSAELLNHSLVEREGWQKLSLAKANQLLELVAKCPIVKHDSSGPAPSYPPPTYTIRLRFEDGEKLEMQILGTGTVVSLTVGDFTEKVSLDAKAVLLLRIVEGLR